MRHSAADNDGALGSDEALGSGQWNNDEAFGSDEALGSGQWNNIGH